MIPSFKYVYDTKNFQNYNIITIVIGLIKNERFNTINIKIIFIYFQILINNTQNTTTRADLRILSFLFIILLFIFLNIYIYKSYLIK